jgi:translation initiation factor 1 (eIF-1/SUI1)
MREADEQMEKELVKEKAINERNKEIAIKMIKANKAVEEIMEFIELSKEEIKELANELKIR